LKPHKKWKENNMLESYDQEIIRKRRAARIFWFLVFSFATFLYFFFQGYYPALDITWKQVFSSWGMRELSREELIRSFGIINIRVYPRDANISINGTSFGFDEKRMVPYGKYRLSVGKPGYIQDRVRFTIDKKMPYFISEINLIPQANYEKIGSWTLEITKLDDNRWISKEWKTHLLYDEYLATWSRIPPWGEPIGEWYTLSWGALFRFWDLEWQKKSWSGSTSLLRTCKGIPKIQHNILWCAENWDALSSDGFLYKNIVNIYSNYLLSNDALYAKKKKFLLNAQERQSPHFIEIENTWYTPNRGLLVPIYSNIDKTSVPLIETTLDNVLHISKLDETLVVFWKKWVDTYMLLMKNNEKIFVPFPSISLEGIELSKSNGTIYIRTNNTLMFLYDGSERIEWLTEWKILANSEVASLYIKDGELWRVSWTRSE
jgi:hypothetical protein